MKSGRRNYLYDSVQVVHMRLQPRRGPSGYAAEGSRSAAIAKTRREAQVMHVKSPSA